MSLADLLKRSSKPDQQKKMINRLTAQVEINQALANSGDLDELMKQAAEARKLVDAERMILYTIEGASLVSRVSGDGKKKSSREVHIPLANGSIPTHVANTGETVNIPDITDPFELKRLGPGITYDTRLFAPLHGRKRAKAILAGPVIYHGRTVGVLEAVNKTSGAAFDFLDVECLHDTAKNLAPLLHQAVLIQRQQAKLTYTENLNEIINRIHAARDVDQILLSVCHDVIALFDAQRITIYAVDRESQELYSKVKEGAEIKEIRVPINFKSIAGYAAAAQQVVNIQDVYNDEELTRIHHELSFNRAFDEVSGFRTRQVMAGPLLHEGEMQGVIQLINTNSGHPFGPDSVQAVQSIATTLAIAMNNRTQVQAQTRVRRSKFDPLIDDGRITQEQIDKAQEIAREEGQDVEEVLMREYKVPKTVLLTAFGAFYRREPIEFSEDLSVPVDLVGELEGQADNLKFARWCPVRKEQDGTIMVAIDDPRDIMRVDNIRARFPGSRVEFRVALRDDIVKMIDHFFGLGTTIGGEEIDLEDLVQGIGVEEVQVAEDEEPSENDNAICRLVNQIIVQAYQKGASDIHIEPYLDSDLEIRYRIDGDLMLAMKLPTRLRNALVTRIKIMCDLDIAERRKPQDGKIRFKKWGPLNIELRVATMPTVGGMEDVVMRILAASKPIPLDGMGMSARNYEAFASLITQPYGIILCVGPTGSGKTTTLHSALGHINDVQTKIWTAEDPVEITQKGLRQVQVNRKAGLDFATIMRSFLRADPDTIMVGEMRDLETTSMGIEASLTGHLVLSTLHTNNAPETLTRLLDMGIDEFSFADALLGVLAQRLARTVCKNCKSEQQMTQEEFARLRAEYGSDELFDELGIKHTRDLRIMMPDKNGCPKCNESGYRGRCALHELLVNSPRVKELIYKRAKAEEVRQTAIQEGMRTLKQDGIEKVFQGLTTIERVREVCVQ